MAPQVPIVNAMLLCEHVHRDSSGKLTLLGVFDEIRVAPAADLESFAVYLSLTNMRGRYAVDLRWIRGDTEEELARVGDIETVEVSDPLLRIEIAVVGSRFPVPGPGRYVLRLTINGRHLHDYAIMAKEAFE
jgi:hypothetical protein